MGRDALLTSVFDTKGGNNPAPIDDAAFDGIHLSKVWRIEDERDAPALESTPYPHGGLGLSVDFHG